MSFLPSLEEFNVHSFLALIDALLHIANTLISIQSPSNILNGIISAIFPDLTARRVTLNVWLLWPSTYGFPSIFIFWGSSIKKGISLSPSLKKVISLEESVLYRTSPKSIAVLLIFILGNTDMNLMGTLKNGFLLETFTTNVSIIGSSSIYSSIEPEMYELNFFISRAVGSLYTITVFSYYEKADSWAFSISTRLKLFLSYRAYSSGKLFMMKFPRWGSTLISDNSIFLLNVLNKASISLLLLFMKNIFCSNFSPMNSCPTSTIINLSPS